MIQGLGVGLALDRHAVPGPGDAAPAIVADAAAVLRMGFAVCRAVGALWTRPLSDCESVIARPNGFDRNVG